MPSVPTAKVKITAKSRLRHPWQLWREMWQDLLASRELAWQLLVRDIKAQYRQSVLGIFWAFIPPIVTAVGFTLASNAKVLNVGTTEFPYPAYVMFSVSLWQTFIEALNAPIQGVITAKPMLAKINFPREAIILAKLGEVFFNFGIKLILIIGLFIFFKMPVTRSVFLAPLGLIQLVMLGTVIGLFLAPLGVLYQDVSRGLLMLTGVWLFLTPVVFPMPQQGLFAHLVGWNPVTPLLVTTRELATTGVLTQVPQFWLVSLLSLVGLFLTWVVYRLAMPILVERMSA
ncbi:MAG: ABC transporter permease [Microcystaceae cyanobacterium]